ncbi:MAG: hypothetical protein E7218_07160 [Anaerofustis stercorihominis]|nr:hypothetical protein [Anaerofustis stercorihominis]
MKNTSYVNCVTKAVYDKREHDTYDKESIRNIFSRSGFTDGYFAGKLGKDMFGVRSAEDKSNSKEAAKLYANVENMQRIPLDLHISVIEGEPLKLCAVDIDGNEALAEGDIVQTAKNKHVDKTFVTDKLTKLGSTVYLPGKVNVELSGSPFVSAAAINSVRREVCEKLDAIRMAIKPRKIIDYVLPKASKKEKLNAETLFYSRLQSISQLNEKIYNLSDKVIIPLYDIENTEGKYIADDKIIVEIPRVYFGDEEKIKDCLNKAKSMGITKAMAHTVGRVKLAKDAGMEVLGGFGLNISNSLSVECIKDMGVDECVLSIELNLNQMKNSRGIIPAGILTYGKIPVMITRNCPSFTFCKDGKKGGCSITDRKGIDFEVVCGNGVSEILNSAPIYLGDKPEDIEKADFALLHFTTETQEQIESILKDYRQIKKNPPSNFTRGCYKRKVE